jgi:hypothetical protein
MSTYAKIIMVRGRSHIVLVDTNIHFATEV